MIQITEEELDLLEARISQAFKELAETKYIFPSLFEATVAENFRALRDGKKEEICSTCVSWHPYMREGRCNVKIKCADTGKLGNQVTSEDYSCKHHTDTYKVEEETE